MISCWPASAPRGEAVFDIATLPEAVAERNRYSSVMIHWAGADALGDVRISGVFKMGDSSSFTRAVVKLHGLVDRKLLNRLVRSPQ